MKVILSAISIFFVLNANAQTGKFQWKLKRELALYNEMRGRLKFQDGFEDFNTVEILDFKLTKDSSSIGAWIYPNPISNSLSAFLNDGDIDVDETIIEQYYSLHDTIYKNVYHVKSDSLWLSEGRHQKNNVFYRKEFYRNKPILQPYLFGTLDSPPYKFDYFYAISVEESSLIQFRKTYSFFLPCPDAIEGIGKIQQDATYKLISKIKQLCDTKDEATKKTAFEISQKDDSDLMKQFVDNLTNNIKNFIDSNEAITERISVGLKYNDAYTVLQRNIKKKQLYKASDTSSLGWYKVSASSFKDAHIRLFQKNEKYYAAIIYDFNMTVLEVIKSEESKSDLKFTPIIEDDIFNIQHFTLLKKNKILSISAKGKISNYDSYNPKYDEWYCDVFFGEQSEKMKKEYPWL
ncbi:MAG: hypothetical protein M9931_07220 [Chitinophagales bacterium]|nr:hypothetical protein [Chitinophagales bacterium]